MTLKQAARPVLGLIVSIFFLVLIFRLIPLSDLSDMLRQARLEWVALGIGVFVLGYACRIWRWRLMLLSENPQLTWQRCIVPFMVSIAANNVLPFRAGDALRAVGFSAWLKVSPASALATLLAERLLDFFVLLLALGLALSLLDVRGSTLTLLVGSSATFLVGLAVTILLVLLFPQAFEPFADGLINLIGRRFAGLAEKLRAQSDKVFATLRSIARGPQMLILLFWSLAAWSFEALVFYVVAKSVPAISDPTVGFLAMPVGTLSTLLPSTPGYVGTFHYFTILAAEAMHNSAVAAGAFAVSVHLVLWTTATAIGGICFAIWMMGQSKRSLSQEALPE